VTEPFEAVSSTVQTDEEEFVRGGELPDRLAKKLSLAGSTPRGGYIEIEG
jgi:hypothetical protein